MTVERGSTWGSETPRRCSLATAGRRTRGLPINGSRQRGVYGFSIDKVLTFPVVGIVYKL